MMRALDFVRQVSIGGGTSPRWTYDGKELFVNPPTADRFESPSC
jgi:hypothetical protein